MSAKEGKKTDGDEQGAKRNRTRVARYLTVAGVLVVYIVGVAFNTGLGSLSAFGVGDVSLICPVGILETAIAGRIILPLPFVVFVLIAAAAVLFGRAFCGWVCPVPLVRKLVTNKEERDHHEASRRKRAAAGEAIAESTMSKNRAWSSLGKGSTTGLGVLGMTLATTLIFGFPVFCLVCPIGLFFATVLAVIRLVAFNELVVDLLVFPAIIVLELVVLRKWCSTLCPVGALLGLFGRLNKRFVPKVDKERCLAQAEGAACDACHRACNFDIDLIRGTGEGELHDCSKCKECAAHCPTQAITFPWK